MRGSDENTMVLTNDILDIVSFIKDNNVVAVIEIRKNKIADLRIQHILIL